MTWSAEEALQHWQKTKQLTAKKAAELQAALPEQSDAMHARAVGIFSAVGAILVGLGIILFVASHWAELTPTLKTALLVALTLGTGIAGYVLRYEPGNYPKTGQALFFVNVLAYGATIFLIAQIYHLPLNFWWGALLWLLGTAFFAYALQSRLHQHLAVPLLFLFLGWLRSTHTANGELDFLFDDRGSIFPICGVIGAALTGVSLLHRRVPAMRFGTQTLFHWGLFSVLLLLVISTIDKTVFFHFFQFPTDPVSLTVLGISAVTIIVSLIWGSFETGQGRGGLIALALYLAFLWVIASLPAWMGFPLQSIEQYYGDAGPGIFTALFIVHLGLVVVFELTVIWFGTLLHRPATINMGMAAIAFTIIIQYFSWAFGMLPRSMAFIVGGLLILALGFALESQRRRLLTAARR